MKQSIIKGITLLVFASFIAAFVWYNVQKSENRPKIHLQSDQISLQADSLKKDTVSVVIADGTETAMSNSKVKEKAAPEFEKKEETKLFVDSSLVGTKYAEPPVHMMAGSKSAIMVEPKFNFEKLLHKKKK